MLVVFGGAERALVASQHRVGLAVLVGRLSQPPSSPELNSGSSPSTPAWGLAIDGFVLGETERDLAASLLRGLVRSYVGRLPTSFSFRQRDRVRLRRSGHSVHFNKSLLNWMCRADPMSTDWS